MGKKKKSAPKKEKTVRVKKATRPKQIYTLQGSKIVREKTECNRCGTGYFMAVHYNRRTCGNCSFTVFTDKDGNVRGGGGQGGPGVRGVVRQSRRVSRREPAGGGSG